MERRQQSRATGLITATAVIFLFAPLILVVLFSFNSTGGLSFPFRGFSLRWYEEIFSSHELRAAALNSLIVATSTALITLVAGTLAAYGLSRTTSRVRGPLALLFFLPITLPGLFLGLALLVSFSRLQIKLSLTTVTLAHLVYVFPYYVLISRAALDRLDRGLEEVAADLGANALLVFRRVTLPQVWPVLLGATCLAFALSFDEFVITFFVVGEDSTLPLFIWSRLRRTIDPSINAVSTLLLLSTLLLFALAFVLALRGERLRSGRAASL